MRLVAAGLLVVAFATACANPTAPRHLVPKASHDNVGDPCTDMFGRSGYLVTAGDKLVCQ